MAASPNIPVPALKIETEKAPAETIVRCTGKITADTADLFQETIRGLIPEAQSVLVDLTGVTHMDSAGLGALVTAWSSARRKSAEMGFRWPEPPGTQAPYRVKVVKVSESVRRVLRLARLDKLLGIADESPREGS